MRYPITIVLMTALGGLIGIAVGSVLLISAAASFKNTLELTEKRSELTVAAIERGVADNLAPAQNLIRDIAHRVADRTLDLSDRNRLAATMSGALAAAPQLGGVVIWQPGVDELWVRRTVGGKITERDIPALTSEQFDGLAAEFAGIDEMRWGRPTFFDMQTFVDLRLPLTRDGAIVGVVATGISLSSLSSLVGDLVIDDLTPFILFGDDKVLAHPALLDPRYAAMLTPQNPLLSIMWRRIRRDIAAH